MKIIFTKTTIFLLFLVPYYSLAQSINISQETALVIKVDFEHLKTKYPDWEEKTQKLIALAAEVEEDTSNFADNYNKVISQLSTSGLSLNTLYLFGINNSTSGRLYVFSFFLDKRARFQEFIEEIAPDSPIQTEKRLQYIQDDQGVCVWNDKQGFLVTADSLSNTEDLKKEAFALMDYQKKNVNHAPQQSFEKFLLTTSDLSIWMNTRKISPEATAQRSPVPFDIDGRFVHTFMDLGNGKASVIYQYFLDTPLPSFMQNLFKKDGGEIILGQGVVDNPLMIVRGGISLPSFLELVESIEPNAVYSMESQFEAAGTTAEEFIDIFDGNFVYWMKDFRKEPTQTEIFNPETEDYEYVDSEKSVPNFVLGIGVKNQERWQDLKENLILSEFLIDQGDYLSLDYKAYLLEKDNILYVTNQAEMRDTLIMSPKQASPNSTEALLDATKNHLFICHFQMSAIPLPPSPINLDFLESFQIGFNRLDDEMMEGELVINFTNKEQSLLDLIYDVASKELTKKKFDDGITAWLDSLAEEDTQESIAASLPQTTEISWDKPEDVGDGVKKFELTIIPPEEVYASKYQDKQYAIYLKDGRFLYYDIDYDY